MSFFSGFGGVFGSIGARVPQRLIVQHLDVVLLAVQLGFHVEKHRQEAGRDLVFEPPAERPGAGRVHVDRADVRHEDLERAAQGDIQALSGSRTVVRHIAAPGKVFFTRGKAAVTSE